MLSQSLICPTFHALYKQREGMIVQMSCWGFPLHLHVQDLIQPAIWDNIYALQFGAGQAEGRDDRSMPQMSCWGFPLHCFI